MIKKAISSGCFLCLLSISTLTLAQDKKKHLFKDMLALTDVTYTALTGYTLFDDTASMILFKVMKNSRISSKSTNSVFATLQNDHEDIKIGITLLPFSWWLAAGNYKTRALLNPKEDVNNTLKGYIAFEADTVKSNVHYYTKKALRKVNATKGAEYDLDMNRVYSGKYTDCKVVILQRDNIGAAILYYFYNDKTKNNVAALIAQTFGILKFKRGS